MCTLTPTRASTARCKRRHATRSCNSQAPLDGTPLMLLPLMALLLLLLLLYLVLLLLMLALGAVAAAASADVVHAYCMLAHPSVNPVSPPFFPGPSSASDPAATAGGDTAAAGESSSNNSSSSNSNRSTDSAAVSAPSQPLAADQSTRIVGPSFFSGPPTVAVTALPHVLSCACLPACLPALPCDILRCARHLAALALPPAALGQRAAPAASGSGQLQLQRRPRKALTPQQLHEWYVQSRGSQSTVRCQYVIRIDDRAGQACGALSHTQSRCFARLSDAWHTEFGDQAELPSWLELFRQKVDIFALNYDAILTAMYALLTSAASTCYLRVPPDPGIEPAALGAGEAAALGSGHGRGMAATGGRDGLPHLRWLTYLLTDLGEAPCSPPVLYVDNKAMLALCQEHRLEHITKHIALRYFLARELQQRGQLRLAYVASWANTADVFTQALQPCDHQRFCTVLGLVPTVPHLLSS
ncbi:unnamed protein product [Closterium sp. NIES-54]